MGAFLAALAAAGDAGVQSVNQNIDQQNKLDQMSWMSDLDTNKAQALDAYKRTQNATTGSAINTAADKLRLDRIHDLVKQNPELAEGLSPEELLALSKNPEAMKALGIRDRTRSEEYDDKSTIAEGMGALDFAKDYKAQQGIEIQRDAQDRMATSSQNLANAKEAETSRKAQHDADWQAAQADKTDAANRRTDNILTGILARAKKGSGEDGDAKLDIKATQTALIGERNTQASLQRQITERMSGRQPPKLDDDGKPNPAYQSFQDELSDLRRQQADSIALTNVLTRSLTTNLGIEVPASGKGVVAAAKAVAAPADRASQFKVIR